MKVVLPVGGDGKRLYPFSSPKAFFPLADGTFLRYGSNVFRALGYEILLSVQDNLFDSHGQELEGMGEVYRGGSPTTEQNLLNVRDEIGGEPYVFTAHTDMVYDPEIIKNMEKLYDKNGGSVVIVCESDYPTGGYVFSGDGFYRIDDLKRCKTIQPLYLLTDEFLRFMYGQKQGINIVDIMTLARQRGLPINWYEPSEGLSVINANHLWEYILANGKAIEIGGINTDRVNPTVGRVDSMAKIDETTEIINCIIMASVLIGEHSRLTNSIIGQNCRIGDNVSLLDLSGDVLIKDPKTGMYFYVDGRNLGIYIGNGCEIGDNVTFRAGVRIKPNTRIADGSEILGDMV